jgi:hypothetical protein
VNIALARAVLGDNDRALQWLDRAFRDHLYLLRMANVDPEFEKLRGDARFQELVGKMGLAS